MAYRDLEKKKKYYDWYYKKPEVIERIRKYQKKYRRENKSKPESMKYHREYARGYSKKPTVKEKVRNYRLRYRYGIDNEKYETLFKAQNGVCAICSIPPTIGKHLQVDHNHVNGINRGLLCQKCNMMLGACNDSVQILQSGISYLNKYK